MNRGNKLATLTAIGGLATGMAVLCTGSAGATNNSSSPVTVTNTSASPVPVSVGNFPSTQQVGGTVNVGNLPATQQVGGTVNVGNLPADQAVHGTVNIGNLPADQQVHGDVGVKDGAPYHIQFQGENDSGGDNVFAQVPRDGAAPIVLDTEGVVVRVPAGAHPVIRVGCGLDEVPIPMVFEGSESGSDFYSGIATNLNIPCSGDDDLIATAYTHPASPGIATIGLDVDTYGHVRR